MKPAILVLTSTYPRWREDSEPGFVHELCRRLAQDYTVHVLTSHSAGAARREQVDGVQVHRFRYAPAALERLVYPGGMLTNVRLYPWTVLLLPSFFLCQLFAAWRLARAERIELIHAHWVIPQGLVAWMLRPLLRGTRLVVTSHGADVYGLQGGLFAWLSGRVWAAADAVTVVSNAMAQAVSGRVPARKLSVAPMGVDLRQAFVMRVPLEERRDVVFVGRLVEKKGVDVLLRGFKLLRDEFPDLRLRIVGDGPWREQLQALAAELSLTSRVEFLGGVPNGEIPSLLNRHAIAVIPSVVAAGGDQEGLGLVAIEAMGCGCAVLASDLPAIRDAVVPGQSGLLFEPGDASALAAGLRTLLQDSAMRQQLAVAGRQFVCDRFDWEESAGRYLRIFQGLH